MDESYSHKKTKTFDAVIAAVNLAAMGSAVNSSRTRDAGSGRIEKKIDDLGARIQQLAEQIKAIQAPQPEQKMAVASAGVADADKKPEGAQQAKAQDVIYVRKSNEFSFYS